MPGFDKSGPFGSGPMTGEARGFCNTAAGYRFPFYGGPRFGRGKGPGIALSGGKGRQIRRGFGMGYKWYPPFTTTQILMK